MEYDAVVVGSGPNGLAAAVVFARQGLRVAVLEASAEPGGGLRTAEATLPGFRHDVCSAVHPLAVASPFLRALPLERYGLAWVHPPVPLAHPLEADEAAVLAREVADTADDLGEDGDAYRRLVAPLLREWDGLFAQLLAPPRLPRRPVLLLRFGIRGLPSAESLSRFWFRTDRARSLLAGLAAHSLLPLDRSPTAAIALVLAVAAHAVGWPIPAGGAGSLASALVRHLAELGGELHCGRPVRSLRDLPPCRVVLLSVTPRQLLEIAGERFPPRYRRALSRYRYGPGVFKLDWALSDPIPWRSPPCARAGTLHLGGSAREIAAAEAEVWRGGHPARPYVILSQPSRFDASRAPEGAHTAWAYCHVPNGSPADMTGAIEAQVERFAPGFRDCILARHPMGPAALESHNPNCVGGDINGGAFSLRQLWFRPVARPRPHATPAPEIFLCSASTPPGGGVHGMCGYHAARLALRRCFGIRRPDPP